MPKSTIPGTATHHITNPDYDRWVVYLFDDFEKVANEYDMYSENWYSNRTLREETERALDKISCGEFKTQHDAEEYIDSISGTW